MGVTRDEVMAVSLLVLLGMMLLCFSVIFVFVMIVFVIASFAVVCLPRRSQKQVIKCLCCFLTPVLFVLITLSRWFGGYDTTNVVAPSRRKSRFQSQLPPPVRLKTNLDENNLTDVTVIIV